MVGNCFNSFLFNKHPSEVARLQSPGSKILVALDTICLLRAIAGYQTRCFENVTPNKYNDYQVDVINLLLLMKNLRIWENPDDTTGEW